MKAEPLTDGELERLFSGLLRSDALVAAVSGGPDSMALMAALARWRALNPQAPSIVAATVDHGLRPESRAEADMVRREAERLGLRWRLLGWTGDKPETGIQEAARNERYRLLAELCRDEKADLLLTAHTMDDQAETVLMRLARGSGLSGLRGMDECRLLGDIRHIRPFLGLGKQRLIASCRLWDVSFVEDPSNDSSRFTRVRWRKLMPALAAEGLDAACLARLASRIARADDALERRGAAVLSEVTFSSSNAARLELDAKALYREPPEIVIRVYLLALARFTDGIGHLRLHRIEDCAEIFGEGVEREVAMRRTLGGVMISLDRGGRIVLQEEPVRKRGTGRISVNRDVENVADRPCTLGKCDDNT